MAIDLVAALRLNDKFTKPMQKVMRSMDNAEKVSRKLTRSTEKVSSSTSKMSRNFDRNTNSIDKHSKALTGLLGGMAAVTAAYGTAQGAVKLFNATVGEAAKMEQSQVVIGAMLNDTALSKQYMDMLDRIAIDSPIFDSQSMYANSKGFITASKDIKQLEKMWGLAERLVAIDPAQGVDGAVLALRELFSGDSMSMVERFEMSRDVMNDIKNLSLDKQLTELDKYFDKIGLTTKVIEDMGNTALGTWSQVKERSATILRSMGEPSLKAVSDFLNKTIDRLEGAPMEKFAQWGGEVINEMVTGLSNNAIKLYDYLTKLTSNPEFQKRTTLTGKINFIVDDVAAKLKKWYEDGGKKQIIDFGENVAQVLVAALDATDEVFELGAKLGGSVWSGIVQGVKKSAAESPIGKVLSASYSLTPQEMIPAAIDRVESKWADWGWFGLEPKKEEPAKSRYHGIDFVPKNNWKADLHRGEAVLPAQEAKAWREGKSGSSSVVSINVANMNVREDGDIEKVAYQLAKYIESAAMQNG